MTVLEAAPLLPTHPLPTSNQPTGELAETLARANAKANRVAEVQLSQWFRSVPASARGAASKPAKLTLSAKGVSSSDVLDVLDGLDPTPGRIGLNYRSPQRADALDLDDFLIASGRKNGPKTLNVGRVLTRMEDDVTLQIRNLDQSLPALATLATAIERTYGAAVMAKAFIANGQGAGLGRHADIAEMWILQLEGQKRWTMWEPSIPGYDQRRPAAGFSPVGDAQVFDISQGDALVVPRSWFHDVEATSTFSVHVSLTVDAPTPAELLESHLQTVGDDPLWLDPVHTPDVASATVEQLTKSIDFEQLIVSGHTRFRAMIPPRHVEGLGRSVRAWISGDSRSLRFASALGGGIHPIEDIPFMDSVVFAAGGRVVRVDRSSVPSLAIIFGGDAFHSRELPGLSSDEAGAFVQQLFAEGLITPAAESS